MFLLCDVEVYDTWSGKLVREVSLDHRAPQEHCLTAAANQNTNFTHSRGSNSQSKQHNEHDLDKTPGLIFRVNTQRSMGVSSREAIRSWSGQGSFTDGCCLVEAEGGGGGGRGWEGGAGFFFLSGHLKFGHPSVYPSSTA